MNWGGLITVVAAVVAVRACIGIWRDHRTIQAQQVLDAIGGQGDELGQCSHLVRPGSCTVSRPCRFCERKAGHEWIPTMMSKQLQEMVTEQLKLNALQTAKATTINCRCSVKGDDGDAT